MMKVFRPARVENVHALYYWERDDARLLFVPKNVHRHKPTQAHWTNRNRLFKTPIQT